MKTKLKIFSLLLLFSVHGYALNTYSDEEIVADYKKGKTEDYKFDKLPLLNSKALIKQGIFSSEDDMLPDKVTEDQCKERLVTLNANPMEIFKCKPIIIGTGCFD